MGQPDAAGARKHDPAASGAVGVQRRRESAAAVHQHRAVAVGGQRGAGGVVGVQHRAAVGKHDVDLRAGDVRHLLGALDVVVGQAVGVGHAGDDANQAAVVRQSLVKDVAGRGLDDRRAHRLVHQHALAVLVVAGIGVLQPALAQVQAIGAGQADDAPFHAQQGRNQVGHRRGAGAAQHADQRNAPVVGRRQQVLGDCLTDRARLAFAGLEVHQQAGAGVDLDDGAAGLVQRAANVGRDQIDAGDVQPDDARRQGGIGGDVGVHLVGDVVRQVAGAFDHHRLAQRRHALGRQALARQFHHHVDVFGQADGVERKAFLRPAARVGVELGVNQLHDAGLAIAAHLRDFAAGGGDDAPPYHQQPVFRTGNEALDHHAAAFGLGGGVGGLDVGALGQVQRDRAAVVAVGRLDHHRAVKILRRFPGGGGAVHRLARRYWHAALRQQFLGQVLVARNALGNGAGAVGFGGPDATLVGAVAQLHQVAVVQPHRGDAALAGGVDDAGGAGPQAQAVDHVFQAFDGGGDVVGTVVDGGFDQVARGGQRGLAHRFVAGADGHLVNAARAGFARLAKAGLHPGARLQLQRHVFHDVCRPGAVAQAQQKAATLAHAATVLDQARQPGGQPFVEAGQGVGWPVFQFANVHQRLDHGAVGPDAGAAQVGHAQDVDVVLAHGRGVGCGTGEMPKAKKCAVSVDAGTPDAAGAAWGDGTLAR